MRRSILTEKLARRGHHISREYSVDLFDVMRVAEVMDPHPPTVREDTSLGHLAAAIGRGEAIHLRRHGLLVLNDRDGLVGVITRGDVFRAVQEGKEELRVGEIATGTPIVTYPNELLRDATGKMLSANIGRLPVVDPAKPCRVIGYVGRAELLRARLKHFREENEREPGWLRVG